MRRFSRAHLIALAWLAIAALSLPAHAGDKLVITGSSTVAPLTGEIARRFEKLHSGTRVNVQTGGSSRGIADARRGLADIGMVSRDLGEKENDLIAHSIALDGICMIVHADNPISALSNEEVVSIYKGELRNWQQIGGNDAPITVIHKANGRSTLELFLDHFSLAGTEVKPSVIIGDNQQGLKTLAGNPDGIAYVSIGAAEYEVQAGTPIKLLPLGNVPASTVALKSGKFPLSRPLNLVTHGTPSALAKKFIDFAQSDLVHDLLEEHFLVAHP